MKMLKIPGKKKPVRAAEWKDVEKAVRCIIKEERRFLSAMANL